MQNDFNRKGRINMAKEIMRCSECGHCTEFRPVGNTRSKFTCEHPDGNYIHQYFVIHRIKKMERFLDYGERYSHEVPLKTSPAWCPRKAKLT